MSDVIDSLRVLTADYQVLYQKLRSYHWNVKGPHFFTLHMKFEELYLDAALRVDALAERVVALGQRPPSTMREALELSSVEEDAGNTPATDMVAAIAADFEATGAKLGALAQAADEAGDTTTVNLTDEMRDALRGTVWMLKAFLA